MQTVTITEARIDGDTLSVTWSDGTRHRFHALWLRERSDSPDNRDPGTGLRVTQAAFLPLDLKIAAAEVDAAGTLHLAFSDGHACGYAADDLRRCVKRPWPDDLVGEKDLWDGSLTDLPEMSFPRLLDEERAVLELLDATARCGFVMVRDIPVEDGALEAFAEILSTTTRRMRSLGAGCSVQVSNCSAACSTNQSTPETVTQPACSASVRSLVFMGL